MKENFIFILVGFFVGFFVTALVSPHADFTIKQVMKNRTVEVNKAYVDSIATLNQELNYHKDLIQTKEHERMAYNLSANACMDVLREAKNEVEFYHKLFLNNSKFNAIKLDTLIITKEK